MVCSDIHGRGMWVQLVFGLRHYTLEPVLLVGTNPYLQHERSVGREVRDALHPSRASPHLLASYHIQETALRFV